ncbi:hypothetical protein LVJ94_40060 [Pendulispora rubella]|uniref:Outer membrane protein beta-barrel domain-containing protein n=1 Tax=Pendulispora rubella TaxID=2741070 RepID=A0ABZ2L1I3_9BACT
MTIVHGWSLMAHAEEAPAPEKEWRPLRYAALEFNAVAPAAGRIGGQLVLGVVGRLSVVAGLTHLSLKDGQKLGEYDHVVTGNPSLQGWVFELGPRLYLSKPPELDATVPRKGRFDWWLGVSHIVQVLQQGGIMSRDPKPYNSYGPSQDIQRQGVAFDLGFQATTAAGFYLSMGVGLQGMLIGDTELHTTGTLGILSDSGDRRALSPRFLFAFGFGL